MIITQINGVPILEFYLRHQQLVESNNEIAFEIKENDPFSRVVGIQRIKTSDIKESAIHFLLKERNDLTFTMEDLIVIRDSLNFLSRDEFARTVINKVRTMMNHKSKEQHTF
jgi:hypothetical protein